MFFISKKWETESSPRPSLRRPNLLRLPRHLRVRFRRFPRTERNSDTLTWAATPKTSSCLPSKCQAQGERPPTCARPRITPENKNKKNEIVLKLAYYIIKRLQIFISLANDVWVQITAEMLVKISLKNYIKCTQFNKKFVPLK